MTADLDPVSGTTDRAWGRRLRIAGGIALLLLAGLLNEALLAHLTHRNLAELEAGTRQNIRAVEGLLALAGLLVLFPRPARAATERIRRSAAVRWLVTPLGQGRWWLPLVPVAVGSLALQFLGWSRAGVAGLHPAPLAVALQGALASALLVAGLAGLVRRRWLTPLIAVPWAACAGLDGSFLWFGGLRPGREILAQTGAAEHYLDLSSVLIFAAALTAAAATALLARGDPAAARHRLVLLLGLLLIQPAWVVYRALGLPFSAPARMALTTRYQEARRFASDPMLRLVGLVLTGPDGRRVATLTAEERAILAPFVPATAPAPLALAQPIRRVVLVTMESLGTATVSRTNPALPGTLTPVLDQVPSACSHLHSLSLPTRPGLASHLCSHPNGALLSETGHPNGLPRLLHDHGYRTCLVQSASRSFEAGERRFREMGYDDIADRDSAAQSPALRPYLSGWGLCDRLSYRVAADWLAAHRQEPVFLHLLTVDTHGPRGREDYSDLAYPETPAWITGSGLAAPYLRAWFRADHDLGLFLADLRARALLGPETAVIITGDHTCPVNPTYLAIPGTSTEPFARIPWFLVSGQSLPLLDPERFGSQADTAPTIAHLVGLPPAAGWWGWSLLEPAGPDRLLGLVGEDAVVLLRDGGRRPATAEERIAVTTVLVP